MSQLDKALTALHASRDALLAELQADVRWQELQLIENAIATLSGVRNASTPAPVTTTSTLTVAANRPAAEDLEDRGTNPLVLAILAEDPTRVWKVESLVAEMNERGWDTDAENRHNALGTALLRLAKREEIEKVGRGRYRAALVTPGAPRDGLGAHQDVATTPHESEPDDATEPDWGTVPSWSQERDMDD